MTRRPKIMLAAGEASGDLHGAALVGRLKASGARLFGLGGPRMKAAGMRLDLDLASHAVIGFVEVIRNLGFFYSAMKRAETLLDRERPDLLVIIDNPGFNLRLAERAKARGIKVCGYISPQVWAWKKNRVHTLRRDLVRLLVTFPFEKPLYDAVGLDCKFVGNPLLDAVKPSLSRAAARKVLKAGPSTPLVGLLPGSRKQEVRWLLPVMIEAARLLSSKLKKIRFALVMAPSLDPKVYAAALESGLPLSVIKEGDASRRYALRRAMDAVMISSGTATLETAILGTPMALMYRVHPWEYGIGRWLVKLPYIGLPNVVAGKKIIPEFIQGGMTPQRVAASIYGLLTDRAMIKRQKSELKAVTAKLGKPGVAARAAKAVLELVKK